MEWSGHKGNQNMFFYKGFFWGLDKRLSDRELVDCPKVRHKCQLQFGEDAWELLKMHENHAK